MNKKMFRSCIYLILYCVLLVVAIVKIDAIISFVGTVLVLLIPLYIGVTIAMILNRPNKYLYRAYCKLFMRGKDSVFCKILSLVSVYVLFFAAIVAVFSFIIPQFVESFKTIYGNLGNYSQNILDFWESVQETFHFQYDVSQLTNEFLKIFENAAAYIQEYGSKILEITTSIFSVITNTLFGLIFSIYLMIDKNRMKYQMKCVVKAYFPKKTVSGALKIGRMSADIIQSYIGIRLMEAAVTGILCFTGLTLFGFKYSIFVSAIIGVTAIVPIFGSWIGCGAALIIFVIVDPSRILGFLIFFILLRVLERYLIFPFAIKDKINLPSLWVIFSVTFLGMAFGLGGMLLAVPVTAIAYELLAETVHRKNREKNRQNSPPAPGPEEEKRVLLQK